MDISISRRLKNLIKSMGKNEFARKCGVRPSTMLGYLNGTSTPNIDNLKKISQACDVTVGWLAAGEQPKKPGVPHDVEDARRMREGQSVPENTAAIIEPGSKKVPEEKPGQERPYHHPAAQVLDEWLQELGKKDPIRSGYFLTELCQRLPEMEEWIKKRQGGNTQNAGVQNNTRKTG